MTNLKNALKAYAITTVFFISVPAYSQSLWLSENGDFFAFEFARGSYVGGIDTKFYSGVYDFSIGHSLTEKLQVIVDVPLAAISRDDLDPQMALGNIYLGARYGKTNRTLCGEFGVFLPTSSQENVDALAMGFFTYLDKVEKYAQELWGVTARLRLYNSIFEPNVFYKVVVGSNYFIQSLEGENDEIILIDYAAQIGYRTKFGAILRGGVSGRTDLYANEFLGEVKSSHLAGVALGYRRNKIEPAIEFKVPIDKPFNEYVHYIGSITLLMHL